MDAIKTAALPSSFSLSESVSCHLGILFTVASNAVLNIKEICNALKTEKKVIMLDHDDLFSSIIRKNEDKNNFQKYVRELIDFCEKENISLLRTVGVMFSDDEKRTTQYEK